MIFPLIINICASVVKTLTQLLCLQQGKVSRYWGESGHSAQVRTSQHVDAIRRRDKSNAFHKHLEIFHPENTGDVETFKFKSEQTFKKSLQRQVTEGIEIANSTADDLLNCKAEYHQPALHRVRLTRAVSYTHLTLPTKRIV